MKFLLCFLLAALASWVAWSEEESVWRLFYAPGGDCEQARQIVHPLLEKGARLVLQELPARAETREAILLQSEAIDAGVRSLPCLVLSDGKGTYATIPLGQFSPENLRAARELASAPDRDTLAQQRRLVSLIFFHTTLARCSSAPAGQRLSSIASLEELAQRNDLPAEQRQFILLRCLYPALVQFYTGSYRDRGAHTPDTERLFRRIIGVVELARDLNPLSKLGRLAFDERERLRASRLEARRLD